MRWSSRPNGMNSRSPDFDQMRTRLKAPLVFDGRNLFEPDQMQSQGFEYFAFGRQTHRAGRRSPDDCARQKKPTVLVTGTAGFIGSHVALYLLGRGERVVGMDNLR